MIDTTCTQKTQTPPNWKQITDTFTGVDRRKDVVFAYYPHVYVPNGKPLPFMLIAHEKVHLEQQRAYEGGPSAWWDRYCEDMPFRLSQEFPAHRAEYYAVCSTETLNRHTRRAVLKTIAKRLSSELYGHLIPYKVALAILPMADDAELVKKVIHADHNFGDDD